jgi:putative hydroxymethylpyrimidine transport system substrate-binding protein
VARLRLALEWFLNPDHVPLILAREFGWLAEAGLELELVEPREHFDAFAAMKRGEVDVAITEPIHLVQDVAKGERMVGFARFLHTNGGVMVRRDRGITRPRDLVGKRLQYPGAPGPGGPAIVNTMIAADGGTPGAIVPVNHGFFHTDALASDLADAATLAFYNFEVVEARHRGLDVELFALKDWGVPDFCQLVLVTLPETLAGREAELTALLKVIRRGIDLLQQDPARAREVWFRVTGGDPGDPLMAAIWQATTSCFTHDLTMSAAYYEALAAWLVRTGQATDVPPPATYWTDRLALA